MQRDGSADLATNQPKGKPMNARLNCSSWDTETDDWDDLDESTMNDYLNDDNEMAAQI